MIWNAKWWSICSRWYRRIHNESKICVETVAEHVPFPLGKRCMRKTLFCVCLCVSGSDMNVWISEFWGKPTKKKEWEKTWLISLKRMYHIWRRCFTSIALMFLFTRKKSCKHVPHKSQKGDEKRKKDDIKKKREEKLYAIRWCVISNFSPNHFPSDRFGWGGFMAMKLLVGKIKCKINLLKVQSKPKIKENK